MLTDVLGDGLQQMGLSEAGLAVDEERVVRLCGRFGNRERRRASRVAISRGGRSEDMTIWLPAS